jgi:hypothetical protein
MHQDGIKILNLLFRPGEFLCVSDSQFGFLSLPFQTVISDSVPLISPNPQTPIKTVNSNELIFVSLNPMKEKSFRRDKEVAKYRNFLIEIDCMADRDMQYSYLKKLGILTSCMIWSGSKSIHCGISLSTDLPNEKIYRFIYKWILNIATMTDQELGNPTRSMRLCGAIRPETGNLQELIEFTGPVELKNLMAWLAKHPESKPIIKEYKKRKSSDTPDLKNVKIWVLKMLKNGFPAGLGRNQGWFQVACEFYLAGFNEDATIDILSKYFVEQSDFREKEFLTSIRSAFKFKSEE